MTARIDGLKCACGAQDLIAVHPGTEGSGFDDLFTVHRGQPVRAWCIQCWPSLKGQIQPCSTLSSDAGASPPGSPLCAGEEQGL